jgi:hypothetical protein
MSLPYQFYHVTSSTKLQSIAENGLNKGSYLSALESLVDYYAETIEDEGQKPVVLVVNDAGLSERFMQPDFNGIEEPIMSVVRRHTHFRNEEELFDAWESSNQGWKDSVSLVGSVCYHEVIPPQHLLAIDLSTGRTVDFVAKLTSKEKLLESPSP